LNLFRRFYRSYRVKPSLERDQNGDHCYWMTPGAISTRAGDHDCIPSIPGYAGLLLRNGQIPGAGNPAA